MRDKSVIYHYALDSIFFFYQLNWSVKLQNHPPLINSPYSSTFRIGLDLGIRRDKEGRD